jgi:hypothetical protein
MHALTLERPGAARLLMRYTSLWAIVAVLGVGMGALAGALGVLGVLGGVVGTACGALRSRRVCGWLERSADRAAQRAVREERETRLQEAGVRLDGLAAATMLVDQITETDPLLASHLELEALLERYVVLELASARCAGILADRYGAHPVPESSTTRARIRVRSAALRQACEVRLAALQDELASIIEFFQLVLQRRALEETELESESDPLGERIALLDDGAYDAIADRELATRSPGFSAGSRR